MNGFEMFLYKCLGISQFKRIVLSLEKLRHRKDGLCNRNYHLQNLSAIALENYYWHLIYNSFLHIIGLLATGLYSILLQILKIHFVVFDCFVWILIILNVYCIILQRYNILKLKSTYKHYCKKQDEIYKKYRILVEEKHLPRFSNEELLSDYEVLIKIKKYTDREANCKITNSDIYSLARFSILLSEIGIGTKERKCAYKPLGIVDFSKEEYVYLRNMEPYGRVDVLVDFVRRIFDKKCYSKYRKNYYLCTENELCEAAFKKVFYIDTYECISQLISILYDIYSERLLAKDEECQRGEIIFGK